MNIDLRPSDRSVSDPKAAWLTAACLCTLLSIAGVADRALGFPEGIPRPIVAFLAWFIEPGLTVWWFTVGGLFAGFPGDAVGYALTVGANVVIWLLVGGVLWTLARFLRRRLQT